MSPTHGAPFRGFRDHEESPFFCAAGLTPEETWDISIDRLAQLLAKLGPLAKSGAIEMSPGLLCSWHGTIFRELFPDGNLRAGYVALNLGLLTVGLDTVEFADLYLHDELLSIAFVGRHDPYRPLAEHITEIIAGTKRA